MWDGSPEAIAKLNEESIANTRSSPEGGDTAKPRAKPWGKDAS
jgi:hypothetical protein